MRAFRRAIGPVLIAVVLAGAVLVGNIPSNAATAKRVGVGPRHQNVLEYTGRIEQNGTLLKYFGYLTYVRGLPSSALFVDPSNASESNAHVTFYGEAHIVQRTEHGHVINTDLADLADIYRQHSAGADFNNSSTFKEGKRIAGLRGRLQNIISTLQETFQAGQEAVSNCVGDFRQRHAAPFTHGGKKYVIGEEGRRFRFECYGWGEVDSTTGPVTHTYIGGHAFIP